MPPVLMTARDGAAAHEAIARRALQAPITVRAEPILIRGLRASVRVSACRRDHW